MSRGHNGPGERIKRIFDNARDEERGVFVAYLTCGVVSNEETSKAADVLISNGVDVVELGVPFSDPVADGPTIQAASETALEHGTTLSDVFSVAKQIRSRHSDVGIVLMGYANPFYIHGLENAAADAAAAGVDGWIVPDVPHEESWRFREHLSKHDIALIPLLAPTTSVDRAVEIVEQSPTPFVYYVSVTGVTGVRRAMTKGWSEPLDALRERIRTPIVIGFGIGDPESAREAISHADGVVVGSALVRRVGVDSEEQLGTFVAALRDAL